MPCSAWCSVRTRAPWFTYDLPQRKSMSREPAGGAMNIADLKKSTEQRMGKSIDSFKGDLAKVRTGRAHTGLLDHVVVDYYGTPTPIPQVGNVTLLDARTIAVKPWDKKMGGAI